VVAALVLRLEDELDLARFHHLVRTRLRGLAGSATGFMSEIAGPRELLGIVRQPGPLHAFYARIRARRGHSVAIVAVARSSPVCSGAC
jgi:hypothetical protein